MSWRERIRSDNDRCDLMTSVAATDIALWLVNESKCNVPGPMQFDHLVGLGAIDSFSVRTKADLDGLKDWLDMKDDMVFGYL